MGVMLTPHRDDFTMMPWGGHQLTSLLLRPECLMRTMSIPWLLMLWLLASPGHQQPCSSPCVLGMSWSLLCDRLNDLPWWRHQMETFSALLALCAGNSPVPGDFPAQRPVTRSFDVFFDLPPNKLLSKQWWGWWFETQSCSLWRHRNATIRYRWIIWNTHDTNIYVTLKTMRHVNG